MDNLEYWVDAVKPVVYWHPGLNWSDSNSGDVAEEISKLSCSLCETYATTY